MNRENSNVLESSVTAKHLVSATHFPALSWLSPMRPPQTPLYPALELPFPLDSCTCPYMPHGEPPST